MKRFVLIILSSVFLFNIAAFAEPSVRVSTPTASTAASSEPSASASSEPSASASSTASASAASSSAPTASSGAAASSSASPTVTAATAEEEIETKELGEAAILIDGTSGAVLYEKNADKKMYPASTTKIATAMVALDAVAAGEASLDDMVTTYGEDLADLPADSSVLGLKDGEEMPLGDLLNGLLVASGNDAAIVIARYIAGSQEAFVERMNELLTKVGAENSHFENAHGLHSENHYTTASDMAKLARYAMQNETFRDYVSNAHIYLPVTNMSDRRYFINTNNLISRLRYTDYYYDKAIGIKTGSTDEAGYCLVSAAASGERELIAVVFNAKDTPDVHTSSKALLEYGFTNFRSHQMAKLGDIISEVKIKYAAGGVDHIPLVTQTAVSVTLPKGVDETEVTVVTDIPEYVAAPVEIDTVIGSVSYVYNGQTLNTVALVSDVTVARHPLGFIMEGIDYIWSFIVVKIIVYLLLAAAIALLVFFIFGFFRALGKKSNRSSSYRPPTYYDDKRRRR